MRYAKFIAEVLATVGAAIVAAFATDGVVTSSEWVNVVIMGLGAITVFGAANVPEPIWNYAKAVLAAATAVAVLLQSAITDGVTTFEWIQLALAALGAIVVARVPNRPVSGKTSAGPV